MSVDADKYLKERLDAEIDWYDGKSGTNKNWNTFCKAVEIICAAVIPLLSGYARDGQPYIALTIGGLGVAVASTTTMIHITRTC